MVKAEWIEDKILKLENDRNNSFWSVIRENQLNFLFNIYRTGNYEKYSKKEINDKLVILYNYS
jgi:hypothetical protein